MILGTNGISALSHGNAGMEDALRSPEELCFPVIALGEFRFGILQSRNRARYEQWLSELVSRVKEGRQYLYLDAVSGLTRIGW